MDSPQDCGLSEAVLARANDLAHEYERLLSLRDRASSVTERQLVERRMASIYTEVKYLLEDL